MRGKVLLWVGVGLTALWLVFELLNALGPMIYNAGRPNLSYVVANGLGVLQQLALAFGAVFVGAGIVVDQLERQRRADAASVDRPESARM